MTIIVPLITFLVCVALPLAFAWRVWRVNETTRARWLAVVLDAALLVLLVMMVGRWDVAGWYTRFVVLALFLVALALSWRRHASRPWRAAEGPPLWRSHWSTLFTIVLFGGLAGWIATGYLARDDARNLAFPLESGWFAVGQGGANVLLNYHYSHPAQRHAVDILALDAAGFRSAGLHPSDPARFAAWGKQVVSPCSGTVAETEDNLPDLAPPKADRENPAGNHIVLFCDGLKIELAHFRQGSIAVAQGDTVTAGQPLGRIGNSGNTTEPHLHIHATDAETGEPVQILFDGTVPARNRTFRR